MIARPPHDRRLGLGGVSLTRARTARYVNEALGVVREELEPILIRSGYLDAAPFWWVTVIIRFGLKNDDLPQYSRIDKKYGSLPLAIEVDTHEMLDASEACLVSIFRSAVLRSLIHAGNKYELPVAELQGLLSNLPPSQA